MKIVVDALGGLGAAHSLTDDKGEPLKIVHRDVSPHNIMVGTDGISRLTDFGVAKAEVRMASTRAGQFKGKLSYMAPEQASTGEADQRSDLFSMGIILWESLTGSSPLPRREQRRHAGQDPERSDPASVQPLAGPGALRCPAGEGAAP
jgi:serine/threonine protein kinase